MNGFRYRAVRLLGHIAVVIGVLAVIAAAFALSYDAVRDIARAAGVPATLARIYPGILDAVFLVACAAALMLRDARWWTRLYAWLSVLVTGGLIGAAGAYHAMGLRLPHRVAAGTVAALPWALVMLGFSLWLSMLRHTRSGPAQPAAAPAPADPGATAAAPLALAASPAARAALPAPEPDPIQRPSVNNPEGHSPDNPVPAGATAAEAPDHRPDRADPPTDPASANAEAPNREAGNSPATESEVPDSAAKDAAATDSEAINAQATNGAAAGAEVPDPDDGDAADSEVLGTPGREPASPGPRPHPSDADTPPYGFPAVTGSALADHAAQNGASPEPGHDGAEPAAAGRTPTLLPAPVPADVEAPAGTGPEAAEAEPDDVAAKGRPPAASPELPGTEAELSHEDRPGDAARKSPAPFERVRSTPTRPAAED
jgi:hypothetical protein